jgi:hypothetical protein
MVTLYFCLGDCAPVLRYWPFVPRVGDLIVLPEFGGNLVRLKVFEVVCEGYDEPSVSVYLHHARTDHDNQPAADYLSEISSNNPLSQ